MSTSLTVTKLREEQKNIEQMLKELESQKVTIDEKYVSLTEEENKVYSDLRECRDSQKFERLQMKPKGELVEHK